MTELSWASLGTPVGPVSVGCSQAGVARVRYGRPPVPPGGEPTAVLLAAAARTELEEYFRGDRRVFDVPVDWAGPVGPRHQVLTVLAETVGYGETISYGALARRAGLPADSAAARAVGTIMAGNPVPVIVPCHRVVASDGLGGYSGGEGVEVKRWLLILEGSHPPTLDWTSPAVVTRRPPG